MLLDVYLPDMTGLEVLRRLRAAGSPSDVIVISAARDVDSIRSALHGGVLHYLVKPFDRRDVRGPAARLRRLRGALEELDEVGQGDVDRLFGGASGSAPAAAGATPKGISPETLELVRGALADAGAEGLSATECSERTGLARVSARRYLEQLVADAAGRRPAAVRHGRAARAPLHPAGGAADRAERNEHERSLAAKC